MTAVVPNRDALAEVLHRVRDVDEHAWWTSVDECRYCQGLAYQLLASGLLRTEAEVVAEVGQESSGPGWFWTRTEWAEWSNDLARLVPEEYEDDVAQEAIIERYLADVPRLIEQARTDAVAEVVERVEVDFPEHLGDAVSKVARLHRGVYVMPLGDLLVPAQTALRAALPKTSRPVPLHETGRDR